MTTFPELDVWVAARGGARWGARPRRRQRVAAGAAAVLLVTMAVLGQRFWSQRTLPLHPVIAELAKTMPSDSWWFPARCGRTEHISGASVTNLITLAKKRAGIRDPRLTPHSLRHSFGSDLMEEGIDIRVIQELMMHASLATTQIYTGVSANRKRAGILTLPSRDIPAHSGRLRVAALESAASA